MSHEDDLRRAGDFVRRYGFPRDADAVARAIKELTALRAEVERLSDPRVWVKVEDANRVLSEERDDAAKGIESLRVENQEVVALHDAAIRTIRELETKMETRTLAALGMLEARDEAIDALRADLEGAHLTLAEQFAELAARDAALEHLRAVMNNSRLVVIEGALLRVLEADCPGDTWVLTAEWVADFDTDPDEAVS